METPAEVKREVMGAWTQVRAVEIVRCAQIQEGRSNRNANELDM